VKKLLAFMLVHLLLDIAIVGYTWQNSQSLRLSSLKEVILFSLKMVPLVLVCNGIFLVVFYCGTHFWGLTFWQVQLAYWATAYVGLVLFWKWNGFVPTRLEWYGVGISLIGALVPIIGPQVKEMMK